MCETFSTFQKEAHEAEEEKEIGTLEEVAGMGPSHEDQRNLWALQFSQRFCDLELCGFERELFELHRHPKKRQNQILEKHHLKLKNEYILNKYSCTNLDQI